MMSHRISENRYKNVLFVWNHRISLIASRHRMGTDSQSGPSWFSVQFIFLKITKMVGCHPIIPQKGPIFVRNAQRTVWFSLDLILWRSFWAPWQIPNDSFTPTWAPPPRPSRAALCCFLGLIIGYIFQILSLIMLPFGINKRNVWNVFSVSNMTFHFLVHRSKWLFLDHAKMLCLMNWIIPKSRDGPWVWIIWGEESPHYLRTMWSAKCWEPPINTVHKWIFVAQGGYLINSTLMDENLCINNDFWESPESKACAECTSHFL